MTPSIFGETVLARLGPVPLTATMVTSFVTTAALIALFASLGRAAVARPDGRAAAAARLIAGFLRGLVTGALGAPSLGVEIFAGTMFVFIAGAAVLGQLPGVASPTSNLAATSALAALVFLAVPIAGVHARGAAGYVKHYFRPNPLLFPLHVVSELSRTLALALRLFGNMMSGHLIVALLVSLAGFLVPVPLMALDLGIGFLQAYIFAILACVYLGAAIQVGEGEGEDG